MGNAMFGTQTVPGDTAVKVDSSGYLIFSGSVASAASTKDAGTAYTTVIGVSGATVATTDNTLTAVTDAPTSGQKIVVDDVIVSVDAACNLLFEIETTGTDLFRLAFAGAGSVQFTPRGKLKIATVDKKMTSKASTTVNAWITVLYHSEA